ncbi:hypothetical protein G9H71_21795, partial [Motilibacter sp. E257]|nr:hypothetical protein [Motilibacter deserti]
MTVPPPTSARCPVEGSLAAYALGALRGEELAQVEAHLRDAPECATCREALEEFRGLPPLLGLLDAAEAVAGPPVPRHDQLDRLVAAAGRERRARRIRRLAAVAAAVVLFAAVGTGWVVGRETTGPSAPTRVTGENRAM